MKSYVAACALAALACSFVVVNAEPQVAGAIAIAAMPAAGAAGAVSAWPEALPAMARRPVDRWLLRAMSEDRRAGTLAPSRCESPAEPRSL
jgi:hypothetical protein